MPPLDKRPRILPVFRNTQYITTTLDLHIIQQELTPKTIRSRKIQVENTNFIKTKILGKILR